MVTLNEKAACPKIVLAGDIGGTKTRIALYCVADDNRYRLVRGRIFPSKKYKGLEMILHEFFTGGKNIDTFDGAKPRFLNRNKKRLSVSTLSIPRALVLSAVEGSDRGVEWVDCACFGVAGPIIKGRVKLTNLPWVIDTKVLSKELKLKKVVMINDLVANAHGISMLKKNDFVTLNIGKERKGNAALISAGTGLGEAILFWDGRRYLPSPSEGGHVEFGPRNRLETELLQYLLKRFNRVSYERMVSGEGLFHIFQFLRDSKKFGSEPKWLLKEIEQQDPAAVISQAARDQKDRLCVAALDIFTSIYGAEAGNLALKTMAIGGVYVGGGIAPKIIWKLKDGTFMHAFRDKGRFSKLMGEIPVKLIMNNKTALLGALSYVLSEQRRKIERGDCYLICCDE